MEDCSTSTGKTSFDISSHKGKKIRSYTIGFTLVVVEYAKMNTNQGAATKFNVDHTSVCEWRRKETDLKDMLPSCGTKERKLDGGGRKPLSDSMEECLLEWILHHCPQRLQVSQKLIMKKSHYMSIKPLSFPHIFKNGLN